MENTSSITEGPQPPQVNIKKEAPKEEPKEADPASGKAPESDTDEFIQNMENHLASTEMGSSAPSPQTQGEDSGSKKNQAQQTPEKPQQTREDDSDTGSQGIEEVVSSDSSQDEVTVDPTTLDPLRRLQMIQTN